MAESIVLDGHTLTRQQVARIVKREASVVLSRESEERVRQSRMRIEKGWLKGKPSMVLIQDLAS